MKDVHYMTQPNPFLQQPQQAPQQNPYAQQPAPQPYAPAPAPAYPQQHQQPQWQQGVASYPPAPPAPQAPAGNGMVAQAGAVGTLAPPPPPGNREATPKVTNLRGRLLIMVPTHLERGVQSRQKDERTGEFKIQDRLTADVVVLDGPPLQWGGETQERPIKVEQIPHVIKGMWFSQRGIVHQLVPTHEAYTRGDAANGLALVRLWQTGPAQNDPYVLAQPTAEDVALFNQFIAHTNPYAL